MVKGKDTTREGMKDVHGNLVVSYEEGEVLGNVGDIYFDRKSCGVQGVTLTPKLLEPDEKNYIRFKDILKLGNSVVIVSKKSALGTLPKSLKGACLRLLRDIRIVSEDGETLGEMFDVDVDTETGIVRAMHLYGDKMMPVDVAKDKIRIGPDMIVVPTAYKTSITRCVRTSKKTKQGEDTLSNVVKNAGKVTRRFADSIASSFNEAVHKVSGSAESKPAKKATKSADRSKTAGGGAKKATAKATGEAPKKKAVAKKKAAKKSS
jgi:uncharacterized protein YrrD